jgi:hypothetical protein
VLALVTPGAAFLEAGYLVGEELKACAFGNLSPIGLR